MNLGVWRMKDFMQSMCNVFVEVYAYIYISIYIYIYMGAFHGIISYPLLLRGPRKARAPIYIYIYICIIMMFFVRIEKLPTSGRQKGSRSGESKLTRKILKGTSNTVLNGKS